ncbi:ComEA family DNA-binding protein [Cobetia marina]|uniref:ComEA family DNA-binding protein n=1 Tax=Cobetia marina TaxID=28258 RepID=UPI002547D25D|nr:helix-hairpin-helix domain-containing protein [Cobetia pacifica]MDI6003240.1 helix-hairpin-helix domain-containing protein [Cobetia pacifica]
MSTGTYGECLELTKEALAAIQSGKPGCVTLAIRKLELCAHLLDDKKLKKWCRFQLGGYIHKLSIPESFDGESIDRFLKKLKYLDIPITDEELNVRLSTAGGGFKSIEFIEQVLARLNREKSGNDGTHYITNIQDVVSTSSNSAYTQATRLYKTLSFGEIPSRQFNVIRDRVDGLLLDICPEAVEKFMAAYERLSSASAEDWSQALTATRRVIKTVADTVYPPKEILKGQRKLGEEQYINRLWAFLDENAVSGSDKDLAKAHIDYLGVFLQRLNDKTSKGVHADVTYNEAVRAVLYTYLTLGDVLEFAGEGLYKIEKAQGKLNINSATREELASIPELNDTLIKEVIKRRVKEKFSSIDELLIFKGVGEKTVEKIKAKCVAR